VIDFVTTCDYIFSMKREKKKTGYPVGPGTSMSVREAKARFSSLLGRAAEGEEITITWHGRPRARLVPVGDEGVPLRLDRAWLKAMPVRKGGTRAEALVREDRDARG
jgi:prevent-host-death family protein